MFGLGKKNKEEPVSALPAEKKDSAALSLNIPEESFTVMPEQYLPQGAASQGGDKKLLWLIIGAVLFLVALSAGLYFFFLSGRSQRGAPQVAQAPRVTNQELETETPPETTATSTNEKIVESQAFDSFNQLIGTLKMMVPMLVANKFGDSLGITVLSPDDVSLPTDSQVAGGIYSPYPLGVTFEDVIAVELIATVLPEAADRSTFYPAYLKGADWEEITGSLPTPTGWSFSLNKFPSGPLAVVRRDAAATSTSPAIGSSKSSASQDTDQDGLTDKEESLLGTSLSAVDTDADTYLDKSELLNGYSPLAAGAKLEDAALFATYTNPTYGYKASYPAKWLSDSLDQTNKQVLFVTDTEEFFEILIEENPTKKPIVDWYRSQSPTLTNVELDVTVVDGVGAVWSPDGLTLYVGKEGLVYIITYNKGTLEVINWPSIFEYFYKSFKFGNTSSASTTPPVSQSSQSVSTNTPPPPPPDSNPIQNAPAPGSR